MTFLSVTAFPAFAAIPMPILILGWVGILVLIGIGGFMMIRYVQVSGMPNPGLVNGGRAIIAFAATTVIGTVVAVFIIRTPGPVTEIDTGTQFLTPLLWLLFAGISGLFAALLSFLLISQAVWARMPRILGFIPPLAFFVALVTQRYWLLSDVTAWVAGRLNVDPSVRFTFDHPLAPPFFIGDVVLLVVGAVFAAYGLVVIGFGLERAQTQIDARDQRARDQQNEPRNQHTKDEPARTTERDEPPTSGHEHATRQVNTMPRKRRWTFAIIPAAAFLAAFGSAKVLRRTAPESRPDGQSVSSYPSR